MAISNLPTAPSRERPATFSAETDIFLPAIQTFATQANALAADVNSKQQTASTAASTATAAKNDAVTAKNEAVALTAAYQGALSNDPLLDKTGGALSDGDWYINSTSGYIRGYSVAGGWVNGIAAVAGVSAVNGAAGSVYIRTLHGKDITGTGELITYTSTAVNKILANMEHCSVTAATQTITLPLSPSEGNECYVSVGSFTDTVIARNGQTIMNLAENMTLDKANATITVRFTNNTWRII